MIYGVIFLLLPVLAFVGLAALPPGRAFLIAAGGVALILAVIWLMRFAAMPPLFTGERASDGLTEAALVILTVAALLGSLTQGLRWLLPARRPGWVYPSIVIGTGLAAGLPILSLLGL